MIFPFYIYIPAAKVFNILLHLNILIFSYNPIFGRHFENRRNFSSVYLNRLGQCILAHRDHFECEQTEELPRLGSAQSISNVEIVAFPHSVHKNSTLMQFLSKSDIDIVRL